MLHPSWGRHEQTTERRAHPAGNVRVWSSDRARAQPLLGRVSAHASGFPELTLGTECAALDYFTSSPLANPTQLSAAKVSASDA